MCMVLRIVVTCCGLCVLDCVCVGLLCVWKLRLVGVMWLMCHVEITSHVLGLELSQKINMRTSLGCLPAVKGAGHPVSAFREDKSALR
mmetsp:Transcript_480/g.482  ORF Transcript_480/g.482 Transcript_480/m.482 type:complete len:88 (+) Transcript_480:96-359(+)